MNIHFQTVSQILSWLEIWSLSSSCFGLLLRITVVLKGMFSPKFYFFDSLKQVVFPIQYIRLYVLTRPPVSVEETFPHNLLLPPPCFIILIVFIEECTVLDLKDKFWQKYLFI